MLSGQSVMPFGKHEDKRLDHIVEYHPDYIQWLQGQEWFEDQWPDVAEYFEHAMPGG